MQKHIIGVTVVLLAIASLLHGCVTGATSGVLAGGRHAIEVSGILSSSTVLQQKFEQKAAEVCGGSFVIENQDYEREGDFVKLVGVVRCQ